jgi:hypothetical protein
VKLPTKVRRQRIHILTNSGRTLKRTVSYNLCRPLEAAQRRSLAGPLPIGGRRFGARNTFTPIEFKVLTDTLSPMDRVLAYVISAGIVAFGGWIFIAGLSSDAPALWTGAALAPIATGLLSAFGDY